MSENHECENWELRLTTPTNLEPDIGDMENMKLSPRDPEASAPVSTLNMDECWTINIKSPATLSITTGEPDNEGFAVDFRLK